MITKTRDPDTSVAKIRSISDKMRAIRSHVGSRLKAAAIWRALVLALAQISQPQAKISFVLACSLLRGSLEELEAAQSGAKPNNLEKELSCSHPESALAVDTSRPPR